MSEIETETINENLFENNLPFTSPLDKNLDQQYIRVNKKNKASLIIVDGQVGEGKTTLAIWLLEYLQNKQIDYDKQYAMGGKQFTEKIKLCYDNKYKVIIYDESGDFNSRGALTRFNQTLNRIFETYRVFKIIVILVLPFFAILDKDIFMKGLPRMLIHCYNRNDNFGNFKVYSLYRMFYLKERMKKSIFTPGIYSLEFPNFVGHFKNLPYERALELEKISITGKKDIVNESILKNNGLIEYHEICRKLNRSLIWVKIKISKLKIEPTQIYKRKKYFDTSIINILEQEKSK